jgi:hypothetical protein
MKAILVTCALFAPIIANAAIVTSVETSAGWLASTPNPVPCSSSDSKTGNGAISSSSSCGPGFPNGAQAAASADFTSAFPLSTLSAQVSGSSSLLNPPFAFSSATASVSQSDLFVAFGGTGSAQLRLTFLMLGQGPEFDIVGSTTFMTLSVNGSIFSCPPLISGPPPIYGFICGSGIVVEKNVAITFGTPFELVQKLTVEIDTNGGGGNGFAQTSLTKYAILNDAGGVISGATLASVPEPATWLLSLTGFGMLAVARRK